MRSMSKLLIAVAAVVALTAGGPPWRRRSSSGRTSTRRPSRSTSGRCGPQREIEKRTNGRYHIHVFPASSLGKESDINQGLTLGTVDMIISGLSFAARTMPRFGVGYYPYTFRDGDHLIKWAKSDVFKQLADEYRQKTGIQVTAMTYYGTRAHVVERGLHRLRRDMKGLKMRVPDVPAYLALPKSLRREPDADRLRRGLSRAAERHRRRAGESADDDRGEEVLRSAEVHLADRPHRRLAATQVAPHVWNKLSDADKKIFTDVTQEAARRRPRDHQARGASSSTSSRRRASPSRVDKKSSGTRSKKTVPLESMGYQKAD